MTQLGVFDPPATDWPVLPGLVHVLYEPGWRKNPDPRAWEIDPATLRHYPVSDDHPFHLLYSISCKTCGWPGGGDYPRENAAVEAGLDHAWPGWRDLPAVEQMPGSTDSGRRARHLAKVTAGYPPGWVAAGGPVRMIREGGRHHWCGWNRYWDISVPSNQVAKQEPALLTLF